MRVVGLGDFDGIDPPVEDGATFAANARIKAMYYARATGQWCLADDSGLEVDALQGAPGVRSARYAGGEHPPDTDRAPIDAANNAKLLRELRSVPPDQRSARFVCHLALANPDHILIETFDTVEGAIVTQPRGNNGFGYDPVFLVPDTNRTAAELTAEEKNNVSHRGKAVRHFATLLKSLLASRKRHARKD